MISAGCVPVRLRRDISAERIKLGKNADWVIQDPLSRNFYYFSDAEYCILRLLDGKRTWIELAGEVSRQLAPQFIDRDLLVRFVAEAKSKGLVEAIETGQRHGEAAAPWKPIGSRRGTVRWWHQPLAIRLPGIYPDRYLDRVFGQQSWFAKLRLSVAWLWFATAWLWLVAIGIAISHFDTLAAEFAQLATTPPPRHVLLFLACVGLTKIIHELGHAVACKLLGGECREIGLMFLMGVPCLYCDVSDAWMMPSRWKRVLISAAGMIVEIGLASFAMILWVLMTPGPWRDAALMVAVIGSFNTVLINGNPLLRYDGYFIFSDLVRVPNLGYEATEALRVGMRKVVWGHQRVAKEAEQTEARVASDAFLVGYGFASATYRSMMLVAIVYAIYRVTAGQGLAWLAFAMAVLIFGRNQYLWWKSIGRVPVGEPISARLRFRSLVIRGVVVMLFVWAWFTPFSRVITVPFSIRPAGHQALYVTVPGRIESSLAAGTSVRRGDVVLTLANEAVNRELKTLETDRRELVANIQALKSQQSGRRNVSAEIVAMESATESLDQRLRWQRDQIDRLSIRAASDGVVYSPPNVSARRTDAMLDEAAEGWSGSPLGAENVGAWLSVGTLVAVVGHDRAREATLMVGQSEIQWVRPNQPVELLRSDFDSGQRKGIVRDFTLLGATEAWVGPPQGFEGKSMMTRDSSDRTYRVLVEIVAEEEGHAVANRRALPVRSIGLAKITVQPSSMHQRTRRWLSQMFAVP